MTKRIMEQIENLNQNHDKIIETKGALQLVKMVGTYEVNG
jgi:hypothetical protein